MAKTFYTTSTSLSNFYTINANGSGNYAFGSMAGTNGTYWSTTNSSISASASHASMTVKGDLEVDGNITVKGRDLTKLMERIEDRLAILQDPDPEKLEKFAALKKAYDHYRLMERLIGDE